MEEMKRASILLSFAALSLLSACQKWEGENAAPMAIDGIQAVMGWEDETRGTVTPLTEYVGRSSFESGDNVVLTKIERTANPLTAYSYNGITYGYNESSWTRTDGENPLYWTDATGHTFIGYSLPQQDAGTFDWNATGTGEYIGSLGDPLASGNLDFSTADKIKQEDLLLAYSTTMTPQSGTRTPLVPFHHALSSVRVVVNLINFAVNSTDNVSISDMTLLNQPTLYLWDQTSSGVRTMASEDQTTINTAWGGSRPSYDQTKNILLYSPDPAAQGGLPNRCITFYGITTPHSTTSTQLSFQVSAPKFTGPWSYTATVNAAFEAGYNTTINITVTYAQ